MGKKLSVDEALEILAKTDSYYLKRDIRKFLKKRGVEIPKNIIDKTALL